MLPSQLATTLIMVIYCSRKAAPSSLPNAFTGSSRYLDYVNLSCTAFSKGYHHQACLGRLLDIGHVRCRLVCCMASYTRLGPCPLQILVLPWKAWRTFQQM